MEKQIQKSKRGGVRKGAGRPRLDHPRVILSMSLDPETRESFSDMAKNHELSQPKMFKILLGNYNEQTAN